MPLSEIEINSYEKFALLHDEVVEDYKKFLETFPFKVGDYVTKKITEPPPYETYVHRSWPFRIVLMEIVQDTYDTVHKRFLSIPYLKIKCNKCTIKKIPTKAFYDFKIDELEPYIDPVDRIERISPTYVYLIEAGNIYKIGFSNNPEKRLYQIQTSNPHQCKILFKIADPLGSLEKDLHKQFAKLRLNGEWFTKSDLILKTFEQLAIDNGTSLRNTLSLF